MNYKKILNNLKISCFSKLKTTLGVLLLLLIILGASAGFYLSQQTQDLRQQASGGVVCSSSTTKSSCGARPGCDWEFSQVDCGPGDCSKNGCTHDYADCTLEVCSSHATCLYIDAVPAQTASCGALGHSACNNQSGCSWQDETWNSCTISDCSSGRATCEWEYTTCTANDCSKSGCSCTYNTGSCDGLNSACSSKTSESSCETAPGSWLCGWTPGSGVRSVSGSYQNGCSGGYHTGTARCNGGSYQIAPAVPASCEGMYRDATTCSGRYTSTTAGSCTGTPTAYCSTQVEDDCGRNGLGCIKDLNGGKCEERQDECSSGEKKCSGTGAAIFCKSNGTWSNPVTCPSGKQCLSSTKQCGDKYCSTFTKNDCLNNGGYGCIPDFNGGSCDDQGIDCERGDSQCTGNTTFKTCNLNGTWGNNQSCSSGDECKSSTGHCATPYCDDRTIDDCGRDNLNCEPDVNGGTCEEIVMVEEIECELGQSRCNTQFFAQTCLRDGSWGERQGCASGLLCNKPPEDLTGKCEKEEGCINNVCQDEDNLKVCNQADGTWSTPKHCSSGCEIVAGEDDVCFEPTEMIIPVGGSCNTSIYNKTCVDGATCIDYRCLKNNLPTGDTCSKDGQCSSNKCVGNKCIDPTTDYCKEICIAKGNTTIECAGLPSCPDDVGDINACTNVAEGGACVTGGKTGKCVNSVCKEVEEAIIASLGEGQECTDNRECRTNNCVRGLCEAQYDATTNPYDTTELEKVEIITYANTSEIINIGGSCDTNITNQNCVSDTSCIYNICRENNLPIGSVCVQNSQCITGKCVLNSCVNLVISNTKEDIKSSEKSTSIAKVNCWTLNNNSCSNVQQLSNTVCSTLHGYETRLSCESSKPIETKEYCSITKKLSCFIQNKNCNLTSTGEECLEKKDSQKKDTPTPKPNNYKLIDTLEPKSDKVFSKESNQNEESCNYFEKLKCFIQNNKCIVTNNQQTICVDHNQFIPVNYRDNPRHNHYYNQPAVQIGPNLWDANSSLPIDKIDFMGDPFNRSTKLLEKIIIYLNVDDPNNKRYSPRNTTTFCNIFVSDVSTLLGVEVPHIVNTRQWDANTTFDYLNTAYNNYLPEYVDYVPDEIPNRAYETGWIKITPENAQEYANLGVPVIVAQNREPYIGHVAIVVPNPDVQPGDSPLIAQAGARNFVGEPVENGGFTKPSYFVNLADIQISNPDALK